jgi:ankyrin repeat protein
MEACAFGHLDVVKLLVALGADLNVKDQQDKAALDLARSAGHQPIESFLLQAGAIDLVAQQAEAEAAKKEPAP